MPLVAVNGIRLNIAIEGAGASLILLHGLGSSIVSLSAEIAAFSSWRRVIAIDARGHGGSDKPASYTIQDHIADVLGLMDVLEIERCALLGRSMGSYIAQGVATSAPGRIESLVLVVPRAHAEEASMTRLRRHLAGELHGKSMEEQRRILLGFMLAPTAAGRKAALLAALAENPAGQLSEAEEAAAMAATAAFDFRAALPKVTARALVISGRHDWLNPPREGAAIAALIPNARHVVLENSGHLPAIEERARYLSSIGEFLAGS
jgi:3-oxoadipate enol-lactonase